MCGLPGCDRPVSADRLIAVHLRVLLPSVMTDSLALRHALVFSSRSIESWLGKVVCSDLPPKNWPLKGGRSLPIWSASDP